MDVPVGAQRPFWVGIESDSAQPVRRVTYGGVSTGPAWRLAGSNYARVVKLAAGLNRRRLVELVETTCPGAGSRWWSWRRVGEPAPGWSSLSRPHSPRRSTPGGRPCRPPDA